MKILLKSKFKLTKLNFFNFSFEKIRKMSSKAKELIDSIERTEDNRKEEVKLNSYEDDLNEDIKSFNTKLDFEEYFVKHKSFLSNNNHNMLLLLDYYSTFIETEALNITSQQSKYKYPSEVYTQRLDLLDDISVIFNESIKKSESDPFLVLSFLESVYKIRKSLDLYSSQYINEVLLTIQYLILRTGFLKQIEIKHYPILLTSYEDYFNIKSTIDVEEVFEKIEYEIILFIKSEHEKYIESQSISSNNNKNKGFKLKIHDFLKIRYEILEIYSLIDCFLIFSKNLEGSNELYEYFCCMLDSYIDVIIKSKIERVIEIYYCLVLVYYNVSSIKNIDRLLVKIEGFIRLYIKESCKKSDESEENEYMKKKLNSIDTCYIDLLKWGLNKRKLFELEYKI